MTPFRAIALLSAAAFGLSLASAAAQDKTPSSPPPSQLIEKLNAYVGCINRLSERSYESRNRYFSWAKKTGPTGKERIIYGTYTIYDTSDCKKNVEKANALEPRDADLEAAASAYAEAVGTLEPLLKEADDYYEQENYKDDKMAKGKALHPRLVAAWDAFASADKKLRAGVEAIKDKQAAEQLAAIEAKEGRKVRYHVEALMIHAKRLLRAEDADKPDISAITAALGEYEAAVKAAEDASGKNGDAKLGSAIKTARSRDVDGMGAFSGVRRKDVIRMARKRKERTRQAQSSAHPLSRDDSRSWRQRSSRCAQYCSAF